MAPFKFGAQAIGERIRDEMSDVRTAGGLFAISKRMDKSIFGTFAEAENYTKEQNRYLAKLAGSLPGDTQEYIQVSKQIADGIFTVVSEDAKNAQKLAQTLATTRGASAAEIAKLSGSGTTAMQATGKELVGEMTKLTVLAGLGGRQGAFGLPQLTERMIAEQKISMGMFQRYSAIFRDPMIKGALERNIKNINATGKNTAARLEALQKTFQEIVTPELVRRYQRTTAGVLEALKTAFLNPEVGLLGLGRPLGAAVTRFDEFGRAMGEIGGKMVPLVNTFEKNGKLYGYTLDKQGRATRQLVEVATEQISIFDSLRDVFANVMIVLQPIIENIALIFDPLANLGGILSGFRDATMKFQSAFERYREFLVGAAKDIADEKTRLQFTATIPLRASLQTINDALRAYGGYAGDAMAEFNRVSALLANPATGMEEMGRILKGMIEKFLSSKFAAKIGNGIGTVIGTVLAEVANMMKATAGLATGGKLAEGFSAGFKAVGGPQAFSDIIKSVFHIFGKLLLEIVKAAPLEAAIVAALFFLPGAIAGLVSQALSGGIARALSKAPSLPTVMPGPRAPGTAGPKGGGFIPALDKLKAPNIIAPIKSAFAYIAQEIRAGFALLKMGKFGIVFQGLLTPFKALGGAIKNLPSLFAEGAKGLGKFGGAITAIVAAIDFFGALLSGKDIWEALGAAAGPVVGTVIGFALGGPIGAAIGSFIGGLEPVTTFFTGVFKGLGEVFGAVGATIGPIFEGLGTAIMSIINLGGSLISTFNPFAGAIGSATGEIDTMKAIIIATKVILWPIVGALQLLEQVINLTTVGLKGLELAVLYARLGLAQLNPFGNEAAKQKLIGAIRRVEGELAAETDKFGKSFARHSQYYVTEVDKAGTAMRNVASSAKEAATNLTKYQKKTREAIAQGKASGLTPTASDMDWYNKATGKPATTPTATNVPAAVPPPAANPVPTIQALNTEQVGTNALLAQINAKILPSGQVNPIPAIQALNTKQARTNALLAQINAKTLPGGQVNPIPAIQALNVKQAGANAFLAQLKTQVVTSADGVKKQIGASSNAQQAKIQGVTTAINNLSAKFTAGMAVRVINTPTVKFDMGGVGPVGGGGGGGTPSAAKSGGVPPVANPVPALQALNVKQSGANALLNQVKLAAAQTKAQVAASSNAQQARIREVTASVNHLNAKLAAGIPVKVINTPTVKFDMGGMGPVGGGIGGFPKTSGYGMRWGKMHTGNDYGMPVGTKLGIGGPGKVLGAGNWGGYGNAMDIGGPGGMVYRFAHLSKINAPVGAMLPPGYPFALSGNTGRSTGPHLHFEARPGGGGPVPPDAFANIIRANFAGTAIGPLMGAMQNEMKGMPYGAQLAVANSDEIFMKPKQMAGVIEGAARAGAEGTGNITTGPITISIDGYNKDPKELTEVIASQLINAMYRKSRSEVLTS